MRSDEAARIIEKEKRCVLTDCERPECKNCGLVMDTGEILEALDMAISALKKQEADRWIPVTERLPKPNTNVIMQCRAKGYKGKYRYFQTIGCYIPALTVKSEEKWNDDCEGVEIYDEKTDSFYCKEGWYEETTQGDGDYMSWYMGANVIAWRPLPEAYTEEES